LVQFAEAARCFRQAEVVAPAGQVVAKFRDDVANAPSAGPPGDVAVPIPFAARESGSYYRLGCLLAPPLVGVALSGMRRDLPR